MAADDQANTLRRLGSVTPLGLVPPRSRAIAVTGGKGGVGKSTVAVNLAVAYARAGAKTLLVDADMGMADLNLLLGVAPARSMVDVLYGGDIAAVLLEAHGVHLLPALNGSYALANLGAAGRDALFQSIDGLADRFDTLVIDTPAGIGENAMAFAGAAADVLVVATPEPLSLADAYACLKVLHTRAGLQRAFVVPNEVRSPSEAEEVVLRLASLADRFLGIKLVALPPVPYDPITPNAAASGVPLVIAAPDCPAARAIKQVGRRLDALAAPDERTGSGRLFLSQLSGAKKGRAT
jgi:flagellar biosynthesis protein FlhG